MSPQRFGYGSSTPPPKAVGDSAANYPPNCSKSSLARHRLPSISCVQAAQTWYICTRTETLVAWCMISLPRSGNSYPAAPSLQNIQVATIALTKGRINPFKFEIGPNIGHFFSFYVDHWQTHCIRAL